ncbi:hypothetical protein [Salinimicrobium sp. GXAS 041]|uniref:hypothetical protein n=1 Tax=Salinimicrobium sp. GXAS 041 TaxID=3400806 RepID=UPI003C717C4D
MARNYTLIYLNAFGYSKGDFIPSELSGGRAVDVCHILSRGMGGDPQKNLNRIENLMAQTREEHLQLGDKKQTTAYQFRKHRDFLEANGVKYDKKWMQKQIEKYSVYETEVV